jgi:ribosomal protein S18 acetylase RimI-like enzyme
MRGGFFRQLESGDIAHIAANLREADRRELFASHGPHTDIAGMVARAVLLSSHTWVGVADDGEPVAVFWAAPLWMLVGIGAPWFLSTDRAYDYPRVLVGEGRRYLSRIREAYPNLFNYVDARNDASIRWLKRLGFTLHPAVAHGFAGEPFHKFEIKGSD